MSKFLKQIIPPLIYLTLATVTVLYATLVWHKQWLLSLEAEAEQPQSELLAEGCYKISTYDNMFRRICGSHGVDWRLMSAIAYGESTFRHDAVSPRGAVGLMQVMPRIARSYDVSREELFDPAINIDVASRLFKSMERMIGAGNNVSNRDRMAFTLAAYNCGASRIIDARNLADYYGDDDSSWEVVSGYLSLLNDEEFYTHEAVKNGRFREASITIYYVEKVMGRYDRYCSITE